MAESTQLAMGAVPGAKRQRLILIAWLFSAIIVLALAFTYYGIGLLSAARAYVGGEGLWSKAQKDAVYSLARYARYHNVHEYQAYRDSLKVNLGDRQARLELGKATPDLGVARAGFLLGRNHPDDIDGMISLFRNFRRVPDIDKAIGIWTRADLEIEQLVILSQKIHAAVQSGQTSDAVILPYLRELYAINQRLMPMEDAFSYTLGEAARKTELVLLVVLFAGVSLCLLAAYQFSHRLVRQSEDIEAALRQGERQLRALLQFAPTPMIIIRLADQAILFANEHALKQFKMTADRLDDVHASDFYVKIEDRERLMQHLQEHGNVGDWEVRMKDAHGVAFWASLSSQCINYYGQACLLTALSNIELRKRHQQELHRRAFYDELTGLPNRAMFMGTLDDTFEQKLEDGGTFALMFLDLDHFKGINDELGHSAGDRLLQEVAQRLKACVADTDVVARLGGDEFVILVSDGADAERLRQTASVILAVMRTPIQVELQTIHITVSIGISCFPQDGADLQSMMKSADLAMYSAKEQGRNNVQWFEPAPS
ncbi:MAG: sensor domain-containing diguanylate cyclase [Pseudomonadota bacterium]